MLFNKINSYDKLVSVLIVVLLMAVFGFFLKSNKKTIPTYKIYVTFSDVSGVTKGTIVATSGFTVGFVNDVYLNNKLIPTVVLSIYKSYKFPTDTSAAILSNGLFGKKYIEMTPGGMDENLKHGDSILYTQSSIDIIDVVDKYLSSLKIEHRK